MGDSQDASEQGEILLDVRTTRAIAKVLREWTNTIHAAVMFEITTLTEGIPRTRAGLDEARDRVSRARTRWEADTGPVQRRMINMVAVTALDAHLSGCADAGKWVTPTARVLDELLPKRTTKDTYFRVTDDRGVVVAGLTLDYDSLVWMVEPDIDQTSSPARTAPLAVIAFDQLSRVSWKRDMGGTILGADGAEVAVYP